ncbi:metallopeptidase family protein [Saccharopolyspora sp. SCSIO 74807]|uniref:metallopeptidase family protein n=1 Tax=Saccharopolyspora sp. SCSIO 74807 TaxID=3118084 RepID=UPI0030CAF7E4
MKLSRAEFEELVADALDTIPGELMRLLNNVVVLVEDEPDPSDPDVLGLYEGIALTERDSTYGGVLPDRITIYRGPTLRVCETLDEVVQEVATTVVHEVGHHFGIDDQRLHELGWA